VRKEWTCSSCSSSSMRMASTTHSPHSTARARCPPPNGGTVWQVLAHRTRSYASATELRLHDARLHRVAREPRRVVHDDADRSRSGPSSTNSRAISHRGRQPWGPQRLRAECARGLSVELDSSTAVLFHNRTRDTLVLYSLDADGDRCITKKLDRGVFLLPVPAAGQKYVVLDASKIGILFRS
jgi:hypothetical protein